MLSFAYFVETSISMVIFIGCYRFFLSRLTFFTWNRIYLVGTLLFSLIAPLLIVPTPIWSVSPTLPSVPRLITQAVVVYQPVQGSPLLNWTTLCGVICAIYWLFVTYRLSQLAVDIFLLRQVIRRSVTESFGSDRIVWVQEDFPTASFFGFIFLNQHQRRTDSLATIIQHEQVHCRQWHSADWLLVRLVSAFFWFHPCMGWWRQAVATNHEYIADAQAAQTSDKTTYAHLLLQLTAQVSKVSTLHYFSSFNQLKSRIIMLHQTRSKAIQKMRFLAVIPLTMGVLFLTSCERNDFKAVEPALLSAQAILHTDLIGQWVTTNNVTINNNDGKTPRIFPERPGNVQTVLSRLSLYADGHFEMSDNRTSVKRTGSWSSDPVGVSVKLECADKPSEPIYIDVTSLENRTMEAWQYYPADKQLSGGTVYYNFQKE
ncbi:hypothetical protein DYU11_31000 [Fibrisoma montanum]|uniref:Peptidase M56 domain-containing protein n=1 Tax=Fibrisoma montanum TaxID=2305895 RepID=A0A418LWV9_9BACT|nr:M56 family metallopeptidase [Fibrisoma montanum]RIV17674.1 hypothetical protein DYU11_31000 [Fibrisoma montanum]